MRFGRSLVAGLLFTSLLVGCPEPEDNVTAPGGAPGAPPAGGPGGPGGPPAGGEGGTPPASADGSTPPPAEGAPPLGNSMMEPPPGLASLIKDGKSVTISGTIEGAKEVQVDFTAVDESSGTPRPKALEILKVTDGKFSVKAPATYEATIYVTAIQDATGNGPTADDVQGGGNAVKLDGKDVTVTIKMGEMTAEAKKLFSAPPEMPAGNSQPPPPEGAAPTPPGPDMPAAGTAPAGGAPPAGGAAPAGGAPAAGGAAPAGGAPQ